MYHLLEKELATFEARTPGSKAALKRAEPRMPLGVASNFRSYEPGPCLLKTPREPTFTISMAMGTSISIFVSAR